MYKLGAFYCQIYAGIKEEGFYDIAKAFSEIRKYDIAGVDFNQTEIDSGTPSLLSGADMFAASVHCATPLDFRTDKLYCESVAMMKEAVDKAVYIKSPYFMAVPTRHKDFEESEMPAFTEAVRSAVKELCAYANTRPITICVEDYSTPEHPYATYEDIDALLNANPDLGFTFDSGNFPLAGINELDAVERYRERTVYVHMKDLKIVDEPTNILRRGKYYDSLEIGGGFVENRRVLKRLHDSGFTEGVITIEVNSEHDRFLRTVKSAEWMKEVLREIK